MQEEVVIGNGNSSARLFQFAHSDRSRAVMEAIPAAMIVIDADGLIQAFSKMAETMFGYCEKEVVGKNVNILMSSPHCSRHDGYLRHYRETGERRIIGSTRVENARHRDGHLFPIELSITETVVEDVHCFVGFLLPIGGTDEHRRRLVTMQAELAHVSRVSAMGALATALAHELNQPLTSIANYTEGLRDLLKARTDIDGVEEYVRILDNCSRQAIRAGQLIHRLREFIKGGTPQSQPVAIENLVDESVSLALINGFKRNVVIETAIPHDLPRVWIDPLQGQQVVYNLISNAFEAMDAEHTGNHQVRISAHPAGDTFVEVSVEDSGGGIDPDILATMFESFVTTKSGGMGVGLAICRQIVEACGGRIWAGRAESLGGAKISFSLPVALAPQLGAE